MRPSPAGHLNAQVQHQKLLTQFQDPSQADQLTKIMHELEQTKMVLHETIEAALERGLTCCLHGSYAFLGGIVNSAGDAIVQSEGDAEGDGDKDGEEGEEYEAP